MGIWLTALKVIPWAEVIAAAPAVTKGARKLFTRAQEVPVLPDEPLVASPPPAAGEPMATLAQLRALEELMARGRAQQQATAALLDAMAAQNAQVVEAIDVLRMRVRLLAWAAAGLGLCFVGSLGLVVWLLGQGAG